MTATTFDWDALVPAVEAPKPPPSVSKSNVRETVPAPIRKRAEESLAKSVKAIVDAKAKGTKEESVPPQWLLQPTPTHEAATEFAKLLKKYAVNRPGTEDITSEKPLEFYIIGSPVGQVTARASAVVIKETDGHVTTETLTEAHKAAPAGTHKFGVRYAVKPLEKRNPTVANGTKATGNKEAKD